MFTDHAVGLDLDYPVARARFLRLAHGDLLDGLSRDAYTDGQVGELRVGPFGSVPGMSKLVRVSLLDPVYRDEIMTVGLRWEATGPAGSLFPVLDANISILPGQNEGTADSKQTARLALTGSYRPPLGRLGTALDKVALHRVATATIRALLQDVAAALTGSAPAENPAKDVCPGLTAVPDAGMP